MVAQTSTDTTFWKDLPCSDLIFTLKYPNSYILLGNYCHMFCKQLNSKDCRILVTTDIDREPPAILQKYNKIENYIDWVESRIRVMYDADGCSEHVHGESIAKNISFTNKYGIPGNEVYTNVTRTKDENGIQSKTTTIKGPVFVFKLHQEIYKNEPAILFYLSETVADSSDLENLKLMMDTFRFKKN